MDAALKAAGDRVIAFNTPNNDDKTDITYGFHPVGNTGHDIGPSMTTWQPFQSTFTLHLQHMFSSSTSPYPPIAEWGGRSCASRSKTTPSDGQHGVQLVHPANYRLLVIK